LCTGAERISGVIELKSKSLMRKRRSPQEEKECKEDKAVITKGKIWDGLGQDAKTFRSCDIEKRACPTA